MFCSGLGFAATLGLNKRFSFLFLLWTMVICCGTPLSINNLAIVKRALPVSFSVKEIALYKGRGGEGKASGGEEDKCSGR